MAIERRAGAPRLIEWTGERCVPWTPDIQVVYEHFHRYWWATELVRGRRVLDVASGEGFGSAILAETAAHVSGVELDATTVRHSQLNYAAPNLDYREGSALELDAFEDGSFGAIVCFELIEHVTDHARLLAGIGRVLAPDGLLILSTPDRRLYTDATGQRNPFHQLELSEQELRALLAEQFDHVRLFGQRAIAGSRIVAFDAPAERTSRFASLRRDGEDWRAGGEPDAMYLVAVASRDLLPELPSDSTLGDPELTIVNQRLAEATEATRRLAAARDELASAERRATVADQARQARERAAQAAEQAFDRELEESFDRFAEQGRELEDQRHESREREQYIDELHAQHAADAAELRRIHGSVVWSTFQRVRGRVYGILGGSDSRRGRAVQRSLRAAGRTIGSGGARATTAVAASDAPRYAPIRFTEAAEPVVSLIVPAYVGADITAACLRSIAECTEGPSYEVIVVDDAGDEDNARLWQCVSGAQVLVNDPGIGYLRSVNRGAAAARGRYLVLMNNDVEVEIGWLRALVRRAESAPNVGAVAPQLIYPDGRLQEAGGIIFRDGSGWNYGRGLDAERYEFNFMREVDYGSAACLLVRADLFAQVGGYDERFLPMYYEDADLCFSLRDAGYRVLYEPSARVVHHEGASAGTDLTSGGKRHQELNRPKFVEKWRAQLEHGQQHPGESNVLRASRRGDGLRVLVIDHRLPTPDHDAGSLRMMRLVEQLVELGCRVTFAPDNMGRLEPYTSQLQALGVDVIYGATSIGQEIAIIGAELKLAIISRPYVAAQHMHEVREHAPGATIAYDTVDLHFVREQRRAELGEPHAAVKAATLRELELGLVRGSDTTIVVSDDERDQLARSAPGSPVLVIPVVNEVADEIAPLAGREGVLFVGGFEHPPNADAAILLVRSIMPLVWEQVPGLRVVIAGSNPTPEVQALASANVEVTGWVEDLAPLIDGARVMAAPLRYGAGMKGKVTQSLGAGLPVVTTSIGAEGLGTQDGREMLIGEDPEALAERIVRVYADDELWRRLSLAGQGVVRRTASLEVMRERLEQLIAQALER
jgi:GT2 family glycosyltransferase/SAM-dependent methyltransferase